MNIYYSPHWVFRDLSAYSHLLSFLILIFQIHKTRSAAGISFKSQALYLLMFICRYLDLIYGPAYRTLFLVSMKIIFPTLAAYVVYLMKFKYKSSWNPALDTFRVEFILVPAFLLALVIREPSNYVIRETLWTFSKYLGAVRLLPQIFQLYHTGKAETITMPYMIALGVYRSFYDLNWMWRFYVNRVVDPVAMTSGLVETGMYMVFLYVYVKRPSKSKVQETEKDEESKAEIMSEP